MLSKLLPLGAWFNTANTQCLLHCSLWKIHKLKTARRCIWTESVWEAVVSLLLPPVVTQRRGRKTQYWDFHNSSTYEELRTQKKQRLEILILCCVWKEYVFLLPGVIVEGNSMDVLLKTLLLVFTCLCANSSLSHCRSTYLSWVWQIWEHAKHIARAGHKVAGPDGENKHSC